MTEKNNNFYATYFNKDLVLKIARWAGIFAWVTFVIYVLTTINSFLQFFLQFATGVFYQKGMSIFDLIGYFSPYFLQLMPGVMYFFGLKFIENALLIFMDIEESTRRSTREK